jgi:hypothetical protein
MRWPRFRACALSMRIMKNAKTDMAVIYPIIIKNI